MMTLSLPFAPKARPATGGVVRRVVMGGKLSDLKRFPRYVATGVLGATLIWAPLLGYLNTAPLSYRSTTSLIMPGSGASASMNVNGIGQATSYANSAFASNAVSPTETYKRLLGADRIVDAAATALNIERTELGQPRVRLVDQTSLIHFETTGRTPQDAQARGDAILAAFFAELDALRTDEVDTRQDSGLQAIADYRASVADTRSQIEALQTSTGLLSAEQYDVLLDRHLALDEDILNQRATLSERAAATTALEAQLGLDAAVAAATLKLFANGSYIAILDEIGRTEVVLADASARYGKRHPRVQAAQSARDKSVSVALSLAQSITGLDAEALRGFDLAPDGARAELLAELVRMHVEVSGAQEQLETLEAQKADGQTALDTFAPVAARMKDLERDFSVAEAIFASAIARAQSSKSDIYASYPLVQVLENPSLPQKPSSPNRKLALMAGIAATLMLLISLAMGWIRIALISGLMSRTGAKT
ncbi:MAG: GumC family protein [Sedimentitalea sp.]